jgi:hypothetical protein
VGGLKMKHAWTINAILEVKQLVAPDQMNNSLDSTSKKLFVRGAAAKMIGIPK